MENYLFVGPNYVIENSGIDKNVDNDKLRPFIEEAHDVFLLPILGESFYKHLILADSGGTATQAEADFITNYVNKYIAKCSYLCALPNLNYRTTNKGVVKQNSEWSTSTDFKEYNSLLESVRDISDMYALRLQKAAALGKKNGDFPLYKKEQDDNPTMQDASQNSMSSLYIPKSNNF